MTQGDLSRSKMRPKLKQNKQKRVRKTYNELKEPKISKNFPKQPKKRPNLMQNETKRRKREAKLT